MMSQALMQWEPISSCRIMTARFNSKGRKVTIIQCQCYAPTNNAEQEKKEEFYRQLQSELDKTSVGDIKTLMGDMNAKLGGDNTVREQTMGREVLGEMNENGELFAEFCAFNDLVIGVRQCVQAQGYPQNDMDSISPDGNTTLKIRSTSSQCEENGDAVYLTQGQEEKQM
ncbi:unnamed protein product [Heterobilharzia americana]|nr:unnamed protein product [Heterobilharzia americana]